MRCKQKRKPQKKKIVRRGDIWFVNLPMHPHSHVQGGTRPVLVYQADRINAKSPVVNCLAVTTKMKRLDLPYHVKLPWITGLPKRSMVLAEQAFTLDKDKLFNYKGNVPQEIMKQVDRARKYVERSDVGKKQACHNKPKYDGDELFKTKSTIRK